MKSTNNLFILIVLFALAACAPEQKETDPKTMEAFEAFKKKDKFVKDEAAQYPGLADPALKEVLTVKINLAANDFQELAAVTTTTDVDYQQKIKTGLDRFSEVYDQLDTEDRERICGYFEELMDIVGLASSGGYLNEFMYGFDPTHKENG